MQGDGLFSKIRPESPIAVSERQDLTILAGIFTKGVRTRMFYLIIYVPCFIPVSCFVVCGFSVLKPILCEGALRHRNARELYSNNLRAVGPKHAQLKTKQNRKQDNKTKHKDQNKVNE